MPESEQRRSSRVRHNDGIRDQDQRCRQARSRYLTRRRPVVDEVLARDSNQEYQLWVRKRGARKTQRSIRNPQIDVRVCRQQPAVVRDDTMAWETVAGRHTTPLSASSSSSSPDQLQNETITPYSSLKCS